MPPSSQARAWVVLSFLLPSITCLPQGHVDPTVPPPPPRPPGYPMGKGGACGEDPPVPSMPSLPPRVEVGFERNATQVIVRCPSPPPSLFPHRPPAPDPELPPPDPVVTRAEGGHGVQVDLTQLVREVGGQVVVDVENCGCVGVGAGVPEWAESLTFAVKGSLRLGPGWWAGGSLRELWVRVDGGVGGSGAFLNLPPTLETLDVSYTPLGDLVLGGELAPPALHRLEAINSALSRISLCTPALAILNVNNNEVGGGLEWAACEGGVGGVLYLHANNNELTSASTCLWPALVTLELRNNLLTSLNLASCTPRNLTTLSVSENYLTAAPTPIPPALEYLNLSRNNISTLPPLISSLREADFSNNNIKEVGKAKFKRARKLVHLSLAHNKLTHIRERELVGLRKLHRLDLSHNLLRSVAPSSLQHLRHLRHLNLHHNQLTHLDARDVAFLLPHTHASLHNNPWECTCQLLSSLTQLQACPDCVHKRVPLKCRERDSWEDSSRVLHSCLQHYQEVTQRRLDESDEDWSEEENDDLQEAGGGATVVVPGLVVLLLAGVTVACGYRLYRKHRRVINSTFAPFCGFCGYCAPAALNNNHHPTQLPNVDQDSDTETEL